MLFTKWVKENLGKKIDFDNYAGVQCVDLIKSYIYNVLGIEPQAIGNAIDYYKKRKTIKYLKDNFIPFDYEKGFKFQRGDIIVLKGNSSYGHIAVCEGKYNNSGVYAYDENYKGSGEGMTLRFFDYDGYYQFKCILRPKNQKNIDEDVKYFPKYKGTSISIVDILASLDINSNFTYRKKIAIVNGIKNYYGSPTQNIKMVKLIKKGKLIKP